MATSRLSEGTTSPSVTFFLQADEFSTNAATNTSVVRAYLVCSPSSGESWYGYNDATVSGSVNGVVFSVTGASAAIAKNSGGWAYGPYDVSVAHNADGSKSASLGLSVSYPNASDTGGSQSGSLLLSTLTVAPGVPTGVAITRDSDTQATVRWTRNEATNGTATGFEVQTRVNGGVWTTAANIAPASSVVIAVAANQKVEAQVRASNGKGTSAWSSISAPMWTTPAAPANVAAAKASDNSITVSWTPKVGYGEYQHVIRHGVVAGTTITWDAAVLATVAAGTTSYRHAAPDTSKVHVYSVAAQSTDVAKLTSTAVQSNNVQLLTAPNAPTLVALPPYVDAAKALTVTWAHNPVDTTAQVAYEMGYSINGGSTWSTTGKVASTTSARTFAASAYPAGTTLTVRVRTWGQATTGGSDGTGASPWSAVGSTTEKTAPVASIITPGSTVNQATLVVGVGFSQAEGATPVNATVQLLSGSGSSLVLLENRTTTTLPGTVFTTRLADGGTYTVLATVLDSNGLTSAPVSKVFTVDYTDPVAAQCVVTYLPDSGMAQLDLTIPTPGTAQAAATALTITRTIGGKTETILDHAPISEAAFSVLDTTPAINTANLYTITTWSADGAATSVTLAHWMMGSQGAINMATVPVAQQPQWIVTSLAGGIHVTTENDGPISGVPSSMATFDDDRSISQVVFYMYPSHQEPQVIPLIPKKVYNISSYFKSSLRFAQASSIRLELLIVSTDGVTSWHPVYFTYDPVSGWKRLSGTIVAPDDASFCRIYCAIRYFTQLAGDWISMAACMITEGPDLHDYFDGSFPDAIWTGEENNSPSQMRGPIDERWAFLNSGPGYADFVNFYGNLNLSSNPERVSALVQTAGRSRPIALYGTGATLETSVSATVVKGEGSTPEQIEDFLLTAGKTCYRDPTGRRMFGLAKGAITNRDWQKADLSVTIQEAQ